MLSRNLQECFIPLEKTEKKNYCLQTTLLALGIWFQLFVKQSCLTLHTDTKQQKCCTTVIAVKILGQAGGLKGGASQQN